MTFVSKKFDLKERSYDFALKIIKMIDTLPKDYSSDVMGRQVMRSATSIGANIVEAQASPSRKDFALFISHSLKSANETKYWLRLLKDAKKAGNEIDLLISESDELSKILGSSLVTLRSGNSE